MMDWLIVFRITAFVLLAVLFVVETIKSPLCNYALTIGEYFHCVSYFLLIELMIKNSGFKGISYKTQIMFIFVHWLRYYDCIINPNSNVFLLSLKIFFLLASCLVGIALYRLRRTYEKHKDTGSSIVIVVTTIILSVITFLIDKHIESTSSANISHFFWILSHYLQGFAMLPQFVFCYRDKSNDDKLLVAYIVILASYRFTYGIKWIFRDYGRKTIYLSGPLGLTILLIFFTDFAIFKICKKSFLSELVLKVDDKIDTITQPLLSAVYGEEHARNPAHIASDQIEFTSKYPTSRLGNSIRWDDGSETSSMRDFIHINPNEHTVASPRFNIYENNFADMSSPNSDDFYRSVTSKRQTPQHKNSISYIPSTEKLEISTNLIFPNPVEYVISDSESSNIIRNGDV